MSYWIGIDGGGSNLRVVVTDESLKVVGQALASTANPSVIGRDEAAARIQQAMREAIASAGADASQIAGVGLGIAGAAEAYAADWLRQVVRPVTPTAIVAPGSDFEIALVGARAERYGLLLLSGTGSVGFAVNRAGQTARGGGWGYLLGDEGSGYWIGLHGLRAVIRAADGVEPCTDRFHDAILQALSLQEPLDLIPWTYQAERPRTRDIAGLARVVLSLADSGDATAAALIESAIDELQALHAALARCLMEPDLPVAFAGGLLENDTALSRGLAARLKLSARPQPRHTPVVGAALLAQLAARGS